MNKYSVLKQPIDVMRDLANRTAELRKQKKYTQVELARRSGVSLGSLRRFEQTGQISLEHLLMVAQLLDRLTEFDKVLRPIENLEEIEKMFRDKSWKEY